MGWFHQWFAHNRVSGTMRRYQILFARILSRPGNGISAGEDIRIAHQLAALRILRACCCISTCAYCGSRRFAHCCGLRIGQRAPHAAFTCRIAHARAAHRTHFAYMRRFTFPTRSPWHCVVFAHCSYQPFILQLPQQKIIMFTPHAFTDLDAIMPKAVWRIFGENIWDRLQLWTQTGKPSCLMNYVIGRDGMDRCEWTRALPCRTRAYVSAPRWVATRMRHCARSLRTRISPRRTTRCAHAPAAAPAAHSFARASHRTHCCTAPACACTRTLRAPHCARAREMPLLEW